MNVNADNTISISNSKRFDNNCKLLLQCHIHKYSFYVEGNINNMSIYHELCLIYNNLFGLNFTFNESLNKSNQNLCTESLPYIVYGGFTIKKGFIPNFLKHLVGFDNNKLFNDKLLSFELENFEKLILIDLQLSLSVYTYFNYIEKTSYLSKFLKFIYQPFKSLYASKKDEENLSQINNIIAVSSRYEALENVKKINSQIENFLIRLGGESYVHNVNLRDINYVDLLIYAACKIQSRIIHKNKRKKYNLDLTLYKNFFNLVEALDNIILNKIKIKNNFKILSPEQMKIHKFVFFDKNFNKYIDTPNETKEIKKRTLIRNITISSFFFGLLVILKLTFKNNN